MRSNIKTLYSRLAAMTKHIFTTGNVTTTVVDLTEGLGDRTPEEILRLTQDGTIKEYSEQLPDGRTITYSLEVEEEILEEEQEIEINSSRLVGIKTADTGETVRSVLEGEEITVNKCLSRTVSREEGVTSREVILSQEKEGGASFSVEWSSGDKTQLDSEQLLSEEKTEGKSANTFLSDQGVPVTEL